MPVPPQPPSYATTSSKQSSATTSTSSLRLKTNLKTKQPHAPRSLDRLFAVDTTRALNVSLPSRYDPYYRFQDKPPVYAPYNSDVLEAMAKYGLTSYSLALSEDSRCWRLYELLQDEKMMRDFMKDPKDWIVRLGPRGQEVEYHVEDIIAARLGIQPNYDNPSEPTIPDPCNTPRPSTPFCNRERDFIKATIFWGGMYEDAEEREYAKSTRARSNTPSSSSASTSTWQNEDGGMIRASSLDTGLAETLKKQPSTIWKTAYEDAFTKEELGRQLDEQAAEAAARSQQVPDSESEDDDDEPQPKSSKSIFDAIPQGSRSGSEDRHSVFRFWNDPHSDDEDQDDNTTVKDKGKVGQVDRESLFQRMGDSEDSDDEISLGDIEPDPSSPQLSTSEGEGECGDLTQDEHSGDSEDLSIETEGDEVMVLETKEKEEEEEVKVAPAPYVRPNAKSFLSMFFRPPVAPAACTESDINDKDEVAIPPGSEASDTPSQHLPSEEVDEETTQSMTLAEKLFQPVSRDGKEDRDDASNNADQHSILAKSNTPEHEKKRGDSEQNDQSQEDDKNILCDGRLENIEDEKYNDRDEHKVGDDSNDNNHLHANNADDDNDPPRRTYGRPGYRQLYEAGFMPPGFNPNYVFEPQMDWANDWEEDEWSVAIEWYQGGPDQEPIDILWTCPITYKGKRTQVIDYLEPTQHHDESEAALSRFYNGYTIKEHAYWIETRLIDVENLECRGRSELMVNWWVRTGQQPPICCGWWFQDPYLELVWWRDDELWRRGPQGLTWYFR